MEKKLDQILVIDIEATCWNNGERPDNQTSDIIEVGVCILDVQSRKRFEKQSIIVKPERSKVSLFCTELTTLTQEIVDQGVSFAEACNILTKQFDSKQRVWASYGEYDRNQFQTQCQEVGVNYPFDTRHINVKTLLALILGLPKEVEVLQALKLLNLSLEGTLHRGEDDAWNIAQILACLLWQKEVLST